MPYRASPSVGPACYRHAAAHASATCTSCLQPVCEICVMFDATCTLCPLCHRRARRVAALGRGVVALLGVAVLVGLATSVGYVVTRERPFDWGMRAPKVRHLLQELEREPCDRAKTVELGDTLNAAGDFRGALKHANSFFRRCGPLPRLLWVTYGAHRHLSELPQAITVATHLIEGNPTDKDYWWWRAVVYEEIGELERAAADYERALDLQPALNNIPFNLANVYERLGRPCDAARPIEQFLSYHPELEDGVSVTERLERLDRACLRPTK